MRGDFWIGERLIRSRLNAIEHHETTLHLEPKVMQVLLVLAAHAGDVVPRQRIRDTVWPDIFVGEDVLVRAISELRRAFEDTPQTQHTIETIPKVGYRLLVPVVEAEDNSSPAVSLAVGDLGAEVVALTDAAKPLQQTAALGAFVRTRWKPLVMAALVSLLTCVAVLCLYVLLRHAGWMMDGDTSSGPATDRAFALAHGNCPLVSGATYEVENEQTGSLLEVPASSATNGTFVDQWKRNGGNNQRWILKTNGPYWTFTNLSSHKMLDVTRASRSRDVQIDQWQANNAPNQNWIILPVGDSSCKIMSQVSGLLLDVARSDSSDGAAIVQYTDNDGRNQHWIFRLISKPESSAAAQ